MTARDDYPLLRIMESRVLPRAARDYTAALDEIDRLRTFARIVNDWYHNTDNPAAARLIVALDRELGDS